MSTPFNRQVTKSYSNDIPISDVFCDFSTERVFFVCVSVDLLVSCEYAWAATEMSDSTAGAATGERDIRDCMYMIFIVAVCTLLEYSFHGQTEKRAVKKSVCV